MHEALLSASVVNVLLTPMKSKLTKFALHQRKECIKHYTINNWKQKAGIDILQKKATLVLLIFSYPPNIFFLFSGWWLPRLSVHKTHLAHSRKSKKNQPMDISTKASNIIRCSFIDGFSVHTFGDFCSLRTPMFTPYGIVWIIMFLVHIFCWSSGHIVWKMIAKAHSGAELKS